MWKDIIELTVTDKPKISKRGLPFNGYSQHPDWWLNMNSFRKDLWAKTFQYYSHCFPVHILKTFYTNNPLNQTDFKHTYRHARAHMYRHTLSSAKDSLTLNGLSVIEFPDVNGIRCFLSPWTHQGQAWETEQNKTERKQRSQIATEIQSQILIS